LCFISAYDKLYISYINLKNPIKAVGSYEIDVKLGHAIHGIIHLEVASL